MHFIATKAGTFLGEGVAGIEKIYNISRLNESGDIVMTQRSSEAGMALLVVPLARADPMDAVFGLLVMRIREKSELFEGLVRARLSELPDDAYL